jgi:hypothetical protein
MILLQKRIPFFKRPRRLYVGGAMILLQKRIPFFNAPADFMSVER